MNQLHNNQIKKEAMDKPVNQQSRELREVIGAIVLTVQDTERYLKFVTPFMGNDDSSMADIISRMEKSKKQTFGNLVGAFLENSSSENKDFQEHFENLVSKRNGLVHHFSELYGADIEAGELDRVVEELGTDLVNLQVFRKTTVQLASEVLRLLSDVTFRGTPELEQLEILRKELELRVAC